MDRPSRSRKTVNYSDFMDDDDDDFATVRAPLNKKARTSLKEPHHEKNRTLNNCAKEIGGIIGERCRERVSLDEKLYKTDLEAALSLSLLQRTETIEPLANSHVCQPPVLTHYDVASSNYPLQDLPPVLSNCSVDVTCLGLDQIISVQTPPPAISREWKTSKTREHHRQALQDENDSTGDEDYKPQNTPASPGVAHSVSALERTLTTPPTPKLAPSSPIGGRLPKWNPPGLVGSSPTSYQSAPVKSPGLGLRLGLSRLARVKPLHPNAAAH
ncbi:RAD51-associated protein 1 isoform X3 [Salminus brasiliensis]|uniref:RAD51-associated protein 1 isoform X3 n=1 Tax=Salminus brasiliensis TaxID=930266 RepID=UPI003B82C987